ncbi:MAG: hypothetical protein A2W28_11610 [Gammaproteobacteria bacterium RBG_16_51_14]|nr:MAG: hypothetical protein A2W28_11610 [Gammaproteobacteria bacterium RBG_16_51_14]
MKNKVISGTGLFLAACLFVGTIILANATLTKWRIDLTENRLFTLSQGTLNILASLDEPVTLDFYFSQKEMIGYPLLMNYGVRVRDILYEYVAHADGKLVLNIIDPETFSEEEDQAVASGLQGIAVDAAGDRAYFGLAGTNSTDDEKVIPFFQSGKESALEYDITKLIYKLAHPEQKVVGVLGQLPLFGDQNQGVKEPWTIISAMKDFFEVRDLGSKVDVIDQDIDVLMVVHPKDLDDATLYALDQYFLHGGKALIFVDPLAQQDQTPPDPDKPSVMPNLDSDLKRLLDVWGVEVTNEKIAGDINLAMRVQSSDVRGPREIDYIAWMGLNEGNFNQDDFSTSELNLINMGTAGIINSKEGAGITVIPLLQTTEQSMQLDRDWLVVQRDPTIFLENFKPEGRKLLLAARLQGHVRTAFPEGKHIDVSAGDTVREDPDFIREGDIHVILVADTDILSDLFWVRKQDNFGVTMPQPIANNGDFVINSIDNLSGNNDLISLRSRGKYARPFELVEAIRKEAETKFREREQELQATLKETEEKIQKLQQEQEDKSTYILSAEQQMEIAKFSQERLKTRKELRAVQHELQKNIERLGSQLRFINIGLIPLLIIMLALVSGIYHAHRRL